MTNDEKKKRIEELKKKSEAVKKEIDYYNALQLALKLVLNGSYGAFAARYFVMFNNNVAGTITAQGRDLTKTMDAVNQHYWYNLWHTETELHKKLCIKNVRQVKDKEVVSIYADTDSLFVSFAPAIDNSDWKNVIHRSLDKIKRNYILFTNTDVKQTEYCVSRPTSVDEFKLTIDTLSPSDYDYIIIDGEYVKNYELNDLLQSIESNKIKWNWSNELAFIQGIDKIRFGDYFKDELQNYAQTFGVDNKEDFELEKISESMINLAKKKYIQNIVNEDGVDYDRLSYIFPKGVELVRSSTPLFARDKIVDIVKYLFSNPDTFNTKDLLKLVKDLRREFELSDIDDIALQSSCSNYETKVLNDKSLPLRYQNGAHFAVKAAAYYNYLLEQNKEVREKYESIKSGTKIKYFISKDKSINDIFAYIRGSYPVEFAPEIDYDEQFKRAILSPINSIIEPLGLPEITKRLTVINDIFAGFGNKESKVDEYAYLDEDEFLDDLK